MCVRACVHVCVRVWVRACMCVCVHACVCVSECACLSHISCIFLLGPTECIPSGGNQRQSEVPAPSCPKNGLATVRLWPQGTQQPPSSSDTGAPEGGSLPHWQLWVWSKAARPGKCLHVYIHTCIRTYVCMYLCMWSDLSEAPHDPAYVRRWTHGVGEGTVLCSPESVVSPCVTAVSPCVTAVSPCVTAVSACVAAVSPCGTVVALCITVVALCVTVVMAQASLRFPCCALL